jgi:hypothetical protein
MLNRFLPSSSVDTTEKRRIGEALIREANDEDVRRNAAQEALTQLADAANSLKKLFA